MNKHNQYIFLDRDGVIIQDKHYIHDIEEIEFMPGALEGLLKLQILGYQFIIITNQAGIARGYFSKADAQDFDNEVIKRLATSGVTIKKSYFCPHHPEFTGECECRKPKIGLAKQAAKEFGIDLSKSIFIGDKDSDTQFGRNAGGLTIRLENKQYPNTVTADYTANNWQEIYEIISNLD